MQTHNINLNSKVEGHLFHLAIGNFDGIHLGHQQIINSLVKKAKESNRPSAISVSYTHLTLPTILLV